MRILHTFIALSALAVLTPLYAHAAPHPSSISHAAWDDLLKRYVRADHRVDYARWKRDGVATLDAYLATLAHPFPAKISAEARQAALINAYNALTVRWVLGHFPVKSIWKTKKPFTAKRHQVDGKQLSLDDLETDLRNTLGARTHSVLVCAARSCPPLRLEAYTEAALQQQLDSNTRQWLANPSLNRFDAAAKTASVSSIFKWYRQDFDTANSRLADFLARFGPSDQSAFLLGGPDPKIRFLDYDWGLNDTGDAGEGYRGFYFDYLRNK